MGPGGFQRSVSYCPQAEKIYGKSTETRGQLPFVIGEYSLKWTGYFSPGSPQTNGGFQGSRVAAGPQAASNS